MQIGLVKWYSQEKGYGVVITPENNDFFLHINSFKIIPREIFLGMPLVFDPHYDQNRNKNVCQNSRVINLDEDWILMFSYLSKLYTVKIEYQVYNKEKFKKKNQFTVTETYNLIESSLKYFIDYKKDLEISQLIIDYFDTKLELNYFIEYCEILLKILPNKFYKEVTNKILNICFRHFEENLNEVILFKVWKTKKFNFINKPLKNDYEIPESTLKIYIEEIGSNELIRIQKFSYCKQFLIYFIDIKVNNHENLTTLETSLIYNLINFEEDIELKKRKDIWYNLYVNKLEFELIDKANQICNLNLNYNNDHYLDILHLIPSYFKADDAESIKKKIYSIFINNSSEVFKIELWINGDLENIEFGLIHNYFIHNNLDSDTRVLILLKLQAKDQFVLLKQYGENFGFIKAFDIINNLVSQDAIDYHFNLSNVLFDREFWQDNINKELVELFIDFTKNKCNDEQKFNLFFKGYLEFYPKDYIPNNLLQLSKWDCEKILTNVSNDKVFIKKILEKIASLEDSHTLLWVYEFANNYLDKSNFNELDKYIFSKVSLENYFKIWESGRAKIFPKYKLEVLLNDNPNEYLNILYWIKNKATSIDEISEFLFSYIKKQTLVTDRVVFYKHFNHIKYLIEIDDTFINKIKLLGNDLYDIILWVFNKDDSFNFELLKLKFIYFGPNEQVKIIKKLFFLKATGLFDLTIEKLNEISRVDLDLYKTNFNFNPNLPIDISTDVIIKALQSFNQKKRFLIESELFKLILDDIILQKTSRFKLSNYFEKCSGRQCLVFDRKTNGEINKTSALNKSGVNIEYFSITFEYEFYLKERVKKIPSSKWNQKSKHWGVLLNFEAEIINFAKKEKFFLNFEGKALTNNQHLVSFERKSIPKGISFCEGRLSFKNDLILNKEFYWCKGEKCYQRCEAIHKPEDWENYTLLDFVEILGFNTDSNDNAGNLVKNGKYYEFISLVNSFNKLLDHLYCKCCNEFLQPSEHGWFTVNKVIWFKCVNSLCENSEKKIYLNHCSNGKCDSVIDNRISNRCPNDLVICKECGSCCSHTFFKNRLKAIDTNDILDNSYKIWVYNETKFKHDNFLGHLERGEYFCYNCGDQMPETEKDIFNCSKCKVVFDTRKFKFERPHKHKILPMDIHKDKDDDEYLFELPF